MRQRLQFREGGNWKLQNSFQRKGNNTKKEFYKCAWGPDEALLNTDLYGSRAKVGHMRPHKGPGRSGGTPKAPIGGGVLELQPTSADSLFKSLREISRDSSRIKH